MLHNYLLIALRNLLRHRMCSAINIAGLSIGIACFILAWLYVRHEMSYDVHHPDVDRIHLVYTISKIPTGERAEPRTPNALPFALADEYAHLGEVVRFFGPADVWLQRGDVAIKEEVAFAEPNAFRMFHFPVLRGAPAAALGRGSEVVISAEVAKRLFNRDDVLGEVITVGDKDFVVSAVLDQLPTNSRLRFHVLIPYARFGDYIGGDQETAWHDSGTHTYLKLNKGVRPEVVQAALDAIVDTRLPGFLKGRMRFGLCPIRQVHLATTLGGVGAPGVSAAYLYALAATAGLVLLIACVNFTNLSIARSSERGMEVGVRTALGARRRNLVNQFVGESVLLSVIGLLCGIALVELVLPTFNRTMGVMLATEYTAGAVAGLLALACGVGVLGGLYPAAIATRPRPADTLKGNTVRSCRGGSLRSALVAVQFVAGIVLVICEIVILRQTSHMKQHDLGFDPGQLIVIPVARGDLPDAVSRCEAYVNRILSRGVGEGIASACLSEDAPGEFYQNKFGTIPEGWSREDATEMVVTSIDHRFVDTYGLGVLEGRNFSLERRTDASQAVLLNETAARRIGWDTSVDKQIRFVHGEGPYHVIGVLRDIHTASLKRAIEPVVFRYANSKWRIGHVSVRVHSDRVSDALAYLRNEWQSLMPELRFEHWLVEDAFAEKYRREERTGQLIGSASCLLVILACTGLIGLIALTVAQRRREIGIRKALGSTAAAIGILLSKEFVVLVASSNVIAWPIAYVLMNRWLEDFAYRIDLELTTFAAGGLLAVGVAALSVSYHAIRAALANPVDALRYE